AGHADARHVGDVDAREPQISIDSEMVQPDLMKDWPSPLHAACTYESLDQVGSCLTRPGWVTEGNPAIPTSSVHEKCGARLVDKEVFIAEEGQIGLGRGVSLNDHLDARVQS